jgi:hypothetical protein
LERWIEALALYKECFNYYKDKETRSSKYSFSYQLTTFALADAYKALHQTDSASYYNQLGYRESKSLVIKFKPTICVK